MEVEGLGQRRHRGRREAAQVVEAHHHVGELHAGVVDVVLDLDRMAEGAQGAHQDVAQDGVSQVADVGRLVGVDVGVLDDDLAGVSGLRGEHRPLESARIRSSPGSGTEVELTVGERPA